MRSGKVYRPRRRTLSPRAWSLIEMLAMFVATAAAIGLIWMVVSP